MPHSPARSFRHFLAPSALLCAAIAAGCSNAPQDAAATHAKAAVSAASDQDLLTQIDDALDFTFENRRLSAGPTDQDQAAWQIIHGALAFKREFLISDGEKDVSADRKSTRLNSSHRT